MQIRDIYFFNMLTLYFFAPIVLYVYGVSGFLLVYLGSIVIRNLFPCICIKTKLVFSNWASGGVSGDFICSSSLCA